jgi:hypothetical protein
MATRIRTLNFLPEIFQTPTNAQFLAATLDQIVDQPNTKRIEGYIGSKFGYGINAKDYYVTEPTKTRTDYQLDPGVVFTKTDESVAQDFISYPGIIDALKVEGGVTENNDRMFESQFYSWDSFTNLDKTINFNQYYWIPEGPERVVVSTETVFSINDYVVTDVSTGYIISPLGVEGGTINPTLTLLRGGTYTFAVNQPTQFYIQGAPGVTGFSPTQPNMQTRDVYGVSNNGSNVGTVTFNVPFKDAQDEYNFPGNNLVDVVSTIPFNQLNGQPVNGFAGVDGITSLDGRTVMFYNTGIPNEIGYVSNFYGNTPYDNNANIVSLQSIDVTATNATGNIITCNTTANLQVGQTITFSGTSFGGLPPYTGVVTPEIFYITSILNGTTFTMSEQEPIVAYGGSLQIGKKYIIVNVGSSDFTLSGAASNTVGTIFTATNVGLGTGAARELLDAGNFEVGKTYTIQSIGTTDFTLIGAASNTVGLAFTATGAGTVAAGSIVPGLQYEIVTVGNTDWNIVAGTSGLTYKSGDLILATVAGSGTGTALQLTTGAGTGTVCVGNDYVLTTATGLMTGFINQGMFEEGFYTPVSQTFYTINYIGDPTSPVINLTPASSIPTNQKITANFGTQYGTRNFYKNTFGTIILIPYISAPLDILYYQDGTNPNKVGIIRLIESNVTNTLDVETDILGKAQFTSSTGIVFTNGLKVSFQGDVIPARYLSGEYYVEGVGSAIELIPVEELVVPEPFTQSTLVPWDTISWDMANWDGNSNIPVDQDYITIARNSINKNAWSRSNRWFHIDVINATAEYNQDPSLISLYATNDAKAKRPIIEFYPNLKLFNSGSIGKNPVDFIDVRTTDAFSFVAGQQNYYPDVEVYTAYTATIASTNYAPLRAITATAVTTNIITINSTSGFRLDDVINISVPGGIGGLMPDTDYYINEIVSSTQFKVSATKGGSVYNLSNDTDSTPDNTTWFPLSTTVTIPASDVTGSIDTGLYIADSTNLLPTNATISEITGTTTLTLTVTWPEGTLGYFSAGSNASLIATTTTVDNYALFDGARVIFAADTDINVKNKIYVSRFSTITTGGPLIITLTPAEDALVLPNDQTVSFRGYFNEGKDFWYDGVEWIESQQKITVNQPPLFDVFDSNGISFGDTELYVGSSFIGNKLFAYGIGNGIDDNILGFPIRYSSVDNVGDISFDVSLNVDTFNYVSGSTPITQKVNTGYVYNYTARDVFERQLGWQTAEYQSQQYQLFDFNFDPLSINSTNVFTCDVANDVNDSWPNVQVFINNELIDVADYTITTGPDFTRITINSNLLVIETVIQVLVLSTQVSKTAYYTIPINLNNNPLNEDLTTVNVGDIRGQYQSIFYNNPSCTGQVFGRNNFRDLGNLVPWGTRIIQNSASLALPGTFLRKPDHNLFNALMYNSKEYVKFKTLLVDTVNNSAYVQRFDPSTMLDDALDQITATKTEIQPFFWSDMLPSKAAFISNTYSFANSLDVSIYPLVRTYDYTTSNYYGVLVYLTRTVAGVTSVIQLIKNQDYNISETSPSLTVTLDLLPGDRITIKEYNQTYGSFVPNTPTKLGLYPSFIPQVVLDSDYSTPTYFIQGHDGSYNKLYGDYNPQTGVLIDFRDQVLLEFEKRIYNNLKLSNVIPISEVEVTPGYFRTTDYSYEDWLRIYTKTFLDWTGQNRIDYKYQAFNKGDEFTYNYWQSGNKLNKESITQGYWRGIYQYYYDTTTPNLTPWEMIGYKTQPSWWTARYGIAPFTSDNLVLWEDMAAGYDYNNGVPFNNPLYARPGLLSIIPVDSSGNLLSPLESIVGNYNSNLFRRDWKVGDDAPAELSYRRSSSYPFDLMRMMALMKPAKFYNLAVNVDSYKYNIEFNQYLVNDRSHLKLSDIVVYGAGTPATSYINWIVDYEKQIGLNATANIQTLLNNIDVRLVYRLAGFSDKTLLKFYVEKGTPNSRNASLLIPDESYSVLLYDNQPFDKIMYSGVVVQLTNNGFAVYGNSQTTAFFTILQPANDGYKENIAVEDLTVVVPKNFTSLESYVPYGTIFYTPQQLATFLVSYGAFLTSKGMKFEDVENSLEINWNQMVAELLYWAQTGWEVGSIVTLNPSAGSLTIDKDSTIVQPLTFRQSNFVLNENLYPIQSMDLSIVRDGTAFNVKPLNQGDSISYGQFNVSNFEHGIVFDNVTLFDDIIYNLITGLRQIRISVRGTKTADWNGTVNASGFILNQDNIKEWNRETKYTKGQIVKYKNKYWTALKIIQAKEIFDENDWKRTDYNEIQKGLLPNSSTRSYESTLYYDINKANLEQDADLLSFSLIGYRPRDYLALADLTDITQINVYKNLLRNKGTKNAASAFKGANLPQGGIDYEIYENWAIKSGEFGGVLNQNFVEFKLNENNLTGNPSIVGLVNGTSTIGVQQSVPMYSLFNYGRPVTDPMILSTVPTTTPSTVYPDAGYVNFNDVKMLSYFYSTLPNAVNQYNVPISLQQFYVRDYVWLADYLKTWQVYTPYSIGQVVNVLNNLNGTATVTFNTPHNLTKYQPFAIVNFSELVDGYYLANFIVDPYRVIVNLTLTNNNNNITGQGIGLYLQSQRVATPSDIVNLTLLNSEFVKNKVWVDENSDGGWAVFQKSINYQYQNEFVRPTGLTFGSAVATGQQLGYLVGDADTGAAYRYTRNDISQEYELVQTITGSNTSFGANISYADDIFVISQPTVSPRIYVYKLFNTTTNDDLTLQQTITALGGSTNWGSSVALSGDKNWLYVSAIDLNRVYVYRKSQLTGDYEYATYVTVSGLVSGDNFGFSIATDYYGDTLIIGTPNQDYSVSIDNWGYTYVFNRSVQNVEAQFNSVPGTAEKFQLAWTPTTLSVQCTQTFAATDRITCTDTTGFTVDDPVIFSGSIYSGSNILPDTVYYIESIVSGTQFRIKTSRSAVTPLDLGNSGPLTGMFVNVQTQPLFVIVNGTVVSDNNYAVINDVLSYTGTLTAGDIITISGQQFTRIQTLTTATTPRIGVHFGNSVDTTTNASEIIIGAPFELNNKNQEGAVIRYTNGGSKYGMVIGTVNTNVTTTRKLLINGFLVFIPAGNATVAANAIINAKISNITAVASNNKLIISLIDSDLATPNEKLVLSVVDEDTLVELGFSLYTKTQTINCPHLSGPTQFGNTIKFNEFDSFVASAPTGTRYTSTTFDYTDDENLDNDTVFDNNATQWIDTFANAGAVYMFDYLPVYNENLNNPGKFVYAQSTNDISLEFGSQPLYGTALDFNNYNVIVGTPGYRPGFDNGQAVTFNNSTGITDWHVFRQSASVVDIDRVNNLQIFSAETNNTLINLDYIDPLQGKILGAARQNIDYISNADPAGYNNAAYVNLDRIFWGADYIGKLWLDTSSMRYVNYHQNDVVYDSKYWGTLFPGSDVAVYTWVSSNVLPINYQGPGTPKDIDSYSIQFVEDASGILNPIYYYWVRNTNLIFSNQGKTLADSVIQSYIQNPLGSGISYMAPILPNVFALYNSGTYFNANDSVLHIGFATGTNDDVGHNQYSLIRANYADDFLPGVPSQQYTNSLYNGNFGTSPGSPESLYDRMLDSMCGVDESGQVVPNPFLPKAVQYGVMARPRQSFFVNRFGALKNYLQYANTVLAQFPITEIRQNTTFLFTEGTINPSTLEPFYRTEDYWEYVNWWAPGYDNNTKSALQVPLYADLSTLNVAAGTVVTVATNGDGKSETYIKENNGLWTRIGLQNGTIAFKSSLWDYEEARLGWGDNFFDTAPYDVYPSEETRFIVRTLNEQIYTDDLLIFRNKSLILLFEYIQSETIESQNYLPWLNKTSFIDVSHKIRELRPIEVFQSDNQDFLAGYLNEIKPYHVVIKEFLFEYTGTDVFEGDVSDFDLPAQYNTTIQQFVSPQLVYANPSGSNEYLPTNAIWQNPEYTQWYQNYGLSIVGQPDFQMATLESYISLNANEFVVDNAYGFPINGVIQIGTEKIAYSNVDRELNVISGLTRGVDGTPITTHLPSQLIFMDLPGIILLDGGRGYSEPPKVTAYIDTSIYPEPRVPAVLEAVMALDTVVGVTVINPGEGYAVLPEIVIDSAVISDFDSSAINPVTNTITLNAPILQTGDLVQYLVGTGTPISGLEDGQWYYVNVLETSPLVTVGLYNNYTNSLYDHDRVEIYAIGTGTHSLNVGARATAVTVSSPVRENNIKLRFDRTTYDSQITNWQAGRFYGAYYAGRYSNSEAVASSSITLESTQPPISSILASAQGVAFEIVDVENVRDVTYSSFVRQVESTQAADDSIKLTLQDDGSGNPNASGGTLGFYIGMPIKFVGAVGGSGLVSEQVYYVNSIISLEYFTVSDSTTGSPIKSLNDATISAAGLSCYVGQVRDVAVMSVNYPGIMEVTATEADTNKLTVPLNITGTGGTVGFYSGLSVFFTGNVFGNVVENDVYYITTVCDNQTFTMSRNENPVILDIIETIASTDTILLDGTTIGLAINDPVIFTNFAFVAGDFVIGQVYKIITVGTTDWQSIDSTYYSGKIYDTGVEFTASGVGTGTGTASSLVFGNINAGQTYYVSDLPSNNEFQISTDVNTPAIALIDSVGTGYVTNQNDTFNLSTATGSMTINVSLPVSPGQVNGQLFTLYETSAQDPNKSGTNTSLFTRDISATLGDRTGLSPVNRVAISENSGGIENLYINMPFQLESAIGGLSAAPTTYYITDIGTIEVEVVSTSSSISVGTVTSGSITSTVLTVNPAGFTGTITVGAVLNGTGIASGTVITEQLSGTYGQDGTYRVSIGQTVPSITSAQVLVSFMTCANADDTNTLYPDMPIIFSGTGLGGIDIDVEYYVLSIIDGTRFTVTNTPGGSAISLTNSSGTMYGTGEGYVQLTTPSPGGAPATLNDDIGPVTMDQFPGSTPIFDVSYILGGYRVVITNPGDGYAIDNTIVIPGDQLGGTTPLNDLTLTVNAIDILSIDPITNVLTSNGEITSLICNGTVPGNAESYYLKVIGSNTFEIYSNSLMTVPVSGIGFQFNGITSSTVTATTASNDITVDTTGFAVNDPVVFTGDVVGGLVRGQTYYILSLTSTTITVGTVPGEILSVVPVTTEATANFTMAKVGDFALLPEPFTFNQSIVKYNNQVYICIISNNDTDFILGKWELLTSGDRRLNALDRIIGYYQPTDNMPGINLSQLVAGITYPNSTYLGNAFAPDEQFSIDTILPPTSFYPTEVDLKAITWGLTKYIAPVDTPEYSGIALSVDTDEWVLDKLATTPLSVTDIIYAGGYYIITTNNTATPIFRSNDGTTWTTNGYYTPYSATPFDDLPFDMTSLSVASLYLNSVAYLNNVFVAVGQNIVRSTDTYAWNQVFSFSNTLTNNFYGVDGISNAGFTGFIAVGQEQQNVNGVATNFNSIAYSSNGINWITLTPFTYSGFNAVTGSTSLDLIVAVGQNGAIYTSSDSVNWIGVNETGVLSTTSIGNEMLLTSSTNFNVGDRVRFMGTSFGGITIGSDYWIKTITGTTITLSDDSGLVSTTALSNAGAPVLTIMYKYPSVTLRDIKFANGIFVAVGETGRIQTSPDGVTWTVRTSGTTEQLNGIAFKNSATQWVVVGENNTVVVSNDNGVTWTVSNEFLLETTTYNIQGDPFMSGYGPEELVPGVVTDNLSIIVNTRPGTNWAVEEYAHVGYNVVSNELTPILPTQVDFSFYAQVQTPAQVAVFVIDGSTGVSTSLYESTGDYTVNWIDDIITLSSPLAAGNKLRIDVYEAGNGDQLVKSSTKSDPIRDNTETGWNEIYVNCNYTGTIFQGSGVVRPGTSPVDIEATETDALTNTITCADVSEFVLNDPITFQGSVFGNITEDTIYYVKTISYVSNTITVSLTYSVSTGTAGPTFALADGTGSMTAVIKVGLGSNVYADPLVYHNGTKLNHGGTGTVTRTNSVNNTVTCNTTSGLIVGTPITFSDSMFSSVIAPQTVYYIESIYDANEFTISTTSGGSVLALDDSTGSASFVTNDFCFGIQPNGTSAKIIFAAQYDNTVDYISYALFGETSPAQYSFTIPEVEMFTGDGANNVFNLNYFVGSNNPDNAIVEINGIRQTSSDYTIDGSVDTITFTSAPLNGDTIAVTTYNSTDRQYFTTQYGLTGVTVSNIVAIQNAIAPPIAITNVTNTTTGTNYVTCISTSGFIVGQTVQFKGTAFGNILTDGTVYYVRQIISGTQFTIEDENGNIISLTTASGLMVAFVGGLEAVRVTTGINHNLNTNDLVRIDGTQGSVQLNNNLYYVHVINSTQFDLYEFDPLDPTRDYDPAYAAVNYPVTSISSYTGGGFVSVAQSYILETVLASATDSATNEITVTSTSDLVVGTPVYFMELGIQVGNPIIGGIVAGQQYFVKEIVSITRFTISAVRGGPEVTLTTDSGTMIVTQWEQDNVDRLWVTVNGYRVPSSSLRLNPGNEVNLLVVVNSGDEVIITSMIPSATPNEEVFIINVNSQNQAAAYRSNTSTRTWLTQPLFNTQDTIYVDDVTRITDVVNQVAIVPSAVNGKYDIGLTADKNLISGITVFNVTTGNLISSTNYEFVVEGLVPILRISSGAFIAVGDQLEITVLQGKLVMINGEQIKFTTVDSVNNTISGLQRGTNGTGEQVYIPEYSEVYSFLSQNQLTSVQYQETWNPIPGTYNLLLGDPLQISDTDTAIFLRQDIT